MCAAPWRVAFSDFQISSRSAYSFSSPRRVSCSVARRLREASSCSFLQRLLLDLELNDAPLQPIERLGLGVDLHADARRGLVDQVDRLVGKLAVGDVAVRQRGRGDDRRVGDVDTVMDLVALLQPAQDRDGVFDRGLIDQHLLEAPLQRGVLLDVLAILIERRRAYAMQLAARQRRLQHVAGVHGAFGLAGADHGVQLVDEEDDLTFLLGQVVEHGLQALLELAAELRTRDQRAHVERQDALVLQSLGHLAVDDALRQTFDDRGLADARLADEHRVVLGAALQHLDGAADLIVAPDDRIELARGGARGQIDGVLLQRLPALLRVGVGYLLAAPHFLDRLLHRAAYDAGIAEDARQIAVLEGREHEELARDELIAALLRQLVGDVEDAVEVVGDVDFPGRALHLGQAIERGAELGAQPVDVGPCLDEQRPHGAALAVEEREQHMGRLEELVVAADGERLGIGQRLLEPAGELVLTHRGRPSGIRIAAKLGVNRGLFKPSRSRPPFGHSAHPGGTKRSLWRQHTCTSLPRESASHPAWPAAASRARRDRTASAPAGLP